MKYFEDRKAAKAQALKDAIEQYKKNHPDIYFKDDSIYFVRGIDYTGVLDTIYMCKIADILSHRDTRRVKHDIHTDIITVLVDMYDAPGWYDEYTIGDMVRDKKGKESISPAAFETKLAEIRKATDKYYEAMEELAAFERRQEDPWGCRG